MTQGASSRNTQGGIGWNYRLQVLARAVCALGGGYALSAVFAAGAGLALVRWGGMSKPEAVTLSTMLSFIVFAVAVLTVFACTSARKAWMCVLLPLMALGVLVWALYGGQA